MTIRVDTNKKVAYPLDNAPPKGTDPIPYEELSELGDVVAGRVALLRITPFGDYLPGIGFCSEPGIYHVNEL